ncbi:MAG: thioesterase family protein [Sphingopyxis sp.]
MSVSLDQILAGASQEKGDWRYQIGADWMQGRTAYGGISAALALDATLRNHPGDAPLRTAQISFVGPVGGECLVGTRLLRQSKSSRFVAADLMSDLGYGTGALFSFMKSRTSHIDLHQYSLPDTPPPDALESIPDHPARPPFTQKFDMRPRRGPSFGHALKDGHIVTWVRWVEQPACDPHIALLALADALPPAAITLFTQFGPMSSSTWIQHFLTDHPQTHDGWWLMESQTRTVANGFSVQSMSIWNSAGELVSVGEQGVALYV